MMSLAAHAHHVFKHVVLFSELLEFRPGKYAAAEFSGMTGIVNVEEDDAVGVANVVGSSRINSQG